MTTANARARREATINLRASVQVRDLIDRAASLEHKTRTEFMLECARERAEEVLASRTVFKLDDADYEAFLAVIDRPPEPTPALRKLLTTPSPWET